MMLAVTLLGIGLGFPIGVVRTSDLRYRRSVEHFLSYQEAAIARRNAIGNTAKLDRKMAYHLVMCNKWTLAARHPLWLFVEPDPPEPE